MIEKQRQRATGRSEVRMSKSETFDEGAEGPSLSDVQLTETFTGTIEGEGNVGVIQAVHKNGSGTFVGIERLRGAIDGRKGTFLLQVTGTFVGKDMNAEWFIIPGSGSLRRSLH